ncbi:hypothetical protein B0T25DRAFT_360285 [Lasiosphaeria hispida]|uniref:Cell wall cysteine-rich protein n=1 Tax=Lasiosphaeria hispida TaxID=260671 RepID=A0AAJ0H7Q0_9PEZI|nr:hypothetical protein B0T25DRAFT_360285 [Lasiosphaeria hispida]
MRWTNVSLKSKSIMFRSVGLATLLGAAHSSAANIVLLPPSSDGLVLGSHGGLAPSGLYTLKHEFGGIEFNTDFPIRSLGMNDIRAVRNPRGSEHDMVCCPPGTVFNGESCVFLASTICPKGFTLDPVTKSVCISTTPPCPLGLTLEDGLCVSTELPKCLDAKATFNSETFECESTTDPVCDGQLEVKGADCISLKPAYCPPGFENRRKKCISTTKPTCGNNPELVVDRNLEGVLICVSIHPPKCPDDSKPLDGKCVRISPPKCPEGYRPEGGSCILTQGPCPADSVFTEFSDERLPVCRTESSPFCESGVLEDGRCISKADPCSPGYAFEVPTGTCTRSEPLACGAGKKAFFTSPQTEQETRAFCCPDVPGMTLDGAKEQCSVPATTKGCPVGTTPDPDNSSLCIHKPTQEDCPVGELDVATGSCIDRTQPVCPTGYLTDKGKCSLGTVKCPTPGAEYWASTGHCHLKEGPLCPEDSIPVGKECISKTQKATCPDGTTISADKKYCEYNAPPKCPEKAKYEAGRQLCVFEDKPECTQNTGTLDGFDCVSPAPPACVDPETTFDSATGQCMGRKRPTCPVDFHIPPGGTTCISKRGPVCPATERLVGGKCISDVDPECPPDSTWIHLKKACVSIQGPCAEGTPDSNGNCATTEPPKCKTPGTQFVPLVGCVSPDRPKCAVEHTKLNEETGECEAEQGPACGPGLELRGDLCVSPQPPHCPPKTEPRDGKCVAKVKAVCDGGLSFNPERKLCIGNDPMCADGSALDKDKAKCITSSSRTCFMMLSCPDVEDDTLPALPGTGQPVPGAGEPIDVGYGGRDDPVDDDLSDDGGDDDYYPGYGEDYAGY